MQHRALLGSQLAVHLHCNVLMYDYCGFGRSDPSVSPTHKQLQIDMRSVMKYALHLQQKEKLGPIWLYGHSIGGAVTLDYLVHAPPEDASHISLLVLDNTIFSLRAVARTIVNPRIRWTIPFVISNVWRNDTLIKKVQTDTIFIVGEQDELVPASHSQLLYQRCSMQFPSFYITFPCFISLLLPFTSGAPHKCLISISDGEHNTNYLIHAKAICTCIDRFAKNPGTTTTFRITEPDFALTN